MLKFLISSPALLSAATCTVTLPSARRILLHHHHFLLTTTTTSHLTSSSPHPKITVNPLNHHHRTHRYHRINMTIQSHLLPVTNPSATSPPRNSSSSSLSSSSSSSPMIKPTSSAAAAAASMLIRSSEDDPGSTRIVIEDERKNEIRPFIQRAASYSSGAGTSSSGNQQKKRRRRVASANTLLTISRGGGGRFKQEMGMSPYDTYLITRLSFTLLRYLGVGYRWITRFLALGCYAFLLFPGFVQVGYYYFFSKQIRRGVVYGDQPRNRLDLYLPKNLVGPKPVVAFVTGGAWIIGYKAWGSLLGMQLAERDVIVACIDYRNFPQGTISDMVKDASQGVSFVCNNIAEYGGDPNRVYLMGQSAGAHIAACTLLEQAIKESSGERTSWSVSQIKAYFGLSGGYNFLDLVDHFHNRGLYRKIFLSIMEGEESLRRYSPEVMVQDPNMRAAVSLLPPIILFHGTADYSIPSDASKKFAETLQSVGVQAESVLYEDKTHTDLFLQDPMRGGRDDMFEDVVGMIHAGDPEAMAKDATAPPRRRLVPEFMLQLARRVSPF